MVTRHFAIFGAIKVLMRKGKKNTEVVTIICMQTQMFLRATFCNEHLQLCKWSSE